MRLRLLAVVIAVTVLLWGATSLPICTGSTVVGCIVNRQGWPDAYGGPYDVYWQAVPTSLTTIDAKTSHLIGLCVNNTTSGALTFTIQSGDSSPLALPLSGSIPANTQVCNNTPWGMLTNGGFAVQSSGTGLLYQVSWLH
jgi:hypothetical protein